MNLKFIIDHITEATGGAEKLRAIGDVLQYALPFLAITLIAFTGSVFAAWYWLFVIVLTSVVTHALKWVFNFTPLGKRPDGGKSSFPSGHTSSSFAGALVLVPIFGWVVAAVPLLLAALTGISRHVNERHHWRDIIAGAALAVLVSYLVGQLFGLT